MFQAVWLYEIAILISDCPTELQTMLESGNYMAMISLKVFYSIILFYFPFFNSLID